MIVKYATVVLLTIALASTVIQNTAESAVPFVAKKLLKHCAKKGNACKNKVIDATGKAEKSLKRLKPVVKNNAKKLTQWIKQKSNRQKTTKQIKAKSTSVEKLTYSVPKQLKHSKKRAPGLRTTNDRLIFRGEINSIIRGSDVPRKSGGKRIFITDEEGKIVKEITRDRVKIRVKNIASDKTARETFIKNGKPTLDDLKILEHLR